MEGTRLRIIDLKMHGFRCEVKNAMQHLALSSPCPVLSTKDEKHAIRGRLDEMTSSTSSHWLATAPTAL